MHLKVKVDGSGSYRWTMVASHEDPTPVACGVCAYADPGSCERAALQLLGAAAGAMTAVQQPDGHWRWAVDGEDGRRLAESATLFDTAAACGYALHDVRVALARELRVAAKP